MQKVQLTDYSSRLDERLSGLIAHAARCQCSWLCSTVQHGLIQLSAVLAHACECVMRLSCRSAMCMRVCQCVSSRAAAWHMPLPPAQQSQCPWQTMAALGHLRPWRGWRAVLPQRTVCNSPCTHTRNNTKVRRQLCPLCEAGFLPPQYYWGL